MDSPTGSEKTTVANYSPSQEINTPLNNKYKSPQQLYCCEEQCSGCCKTILLTPDDNTCGSCSSHQTLGKLQVRPSNKKPNAQNLLVAFNAVADDL